METKTARISNLKAGTDAGDFARMTEPERRKAILRLAGHLVNLMSNPSNSILEGYDFAQSIAKAFAAEKYVELGRRKRKLSPLAVSVQAVRAPSHLPIPSTVNPEVIGAVKA